MLQRYGAYALIAGLAVAVVVGVIPDFDSKPIQAVLLVLGLAGGALSIRRERSSDFLLAGVALMLVANVRSELARLSSLGDAVELSLRNVYIVMAAASLVLAVKVILSATKKP